LLRTAQLLVVGVVVVVEIVAMAMAGVAVAAVNTEAVVASPEVAAVVEVMAIVLHAANSEAVAAPVAALLLPVPTTARPSHHWVPNLAKPPHTHFHGVPRVSQGCILGNIKSKGYRSGKLAGSALSEI
jgi:hypothetical protein